MRMPNNYVLESLYKYASHYICCGFDSRVCTSRYVYTLYLDVGFPGHDVIQRYPIRCPDDIQQIAFDRPDCYNDLLDGWRRRGG